ncbi:sulfotransferase [Candidatus Poribacteria bacterium]|nr:sulfotransferase [Candidatus Poribacteria bacterium]MYJ94930.1 sulfotransferase [Pseudomonadota bacterium]
MEAAFDLDSVLAAAREEAGLEDFGDTGFTEALAKLLECVSRDLQFSDPGFRAFQANVRRWLVNRLRYVDGVKANPEVLEEDVSDPIIVLGMPRCGTTKMQRLLSVTPGSIPLPLWMTQNPAPFPDEQPGNPAGRIAFARAIQEAQRANNPEFLASHERTAEQAEEDSDLLLFAIDYLMMFIVHPSDALLDWLRERPRLPAYEMQRKLLQYLQWQQGGKQGRRWVLKNPGHIGQLDALSTVYPKATILHLHRDLRTVLPSYCQLIRAIYLDLFDEYNPQRIGRQTLAYWGPEFRRHRAQREKLQDRLNIVDASYQAVLDNAVGVAAEVLARAGITMTGETETALKQWQAENAQHKHGKSSYSMEEFGLDDNAILAAFGTFDEAEDWT